MARTLAGVNTESIPRNQTFVGDVGKPIYGIVLNKATPGL